MSTSLISFLRFYCDHDIINIYVYTQNTQNTQNKKQNTIDNLNIKKYIICKNNDIDCSICCNKVKHSEYIRELNCKHFFHKKCVDKWFKYCIKNDQDINCPLCRSTINYN